MQQKSLFFLRGWLHLQNQPQQWRKTADVLISLPQSVVLRNMLEAVNQEHSKMKLQMAWGLLDPRSNVQLLLAHLLQAYAFSVKCYRQDKTSDELVHFVHKAHIGEKLSKSSSAAICYDDIVIKYAELTRISNSSGHSFTEQLKRLIQLRLKVESTTKQALMLPRKSTIRCAKT